MQHNFRLAKPYGLANQMLCYIQMLLTIEKSGEQDQNVLKNAWCITDSGTLLTDSAAN